MQATLYAVIIIVLGLLVIHISCKLALRVNAFPAFVPSAAGKTGHGHTSPVHDTPQKDFGTRRQFTTVVFIGIALTGLMSVMLVILTQSQWTSWLVGPLSGLLENFSANDFAFIVGSLIAFSQLPSLARRLKLNGWQTGILTLGFAGLVYAWGFHHSWLTLDLLALTIAAAGIIGFQPWVSFMRAWSIMMVLAVLYDAIQVYYSGNMTTFASESMGGLHPAVHATPEQIAAAPPEMQRIAVEQKDTLALPFLVLLPQSWSLSTGAGSGLGLGDICFSGVLILLAARMALKTGKPQLYYAALGGFALGMVLATVAVEVFSASQPATIFLFPAIGLSVIVAAKICGVSQELSLKPQLQPAEKLEDA